MYKFGLVFVLSLVQARPQISLEYKPTRPFHHPRPSGSHLSPIVPPGKPWPAGSNGDQNFSQSNINLVDRIKDTSSTTAPSSSTGFIWPSPVPEDEQNVPFTSKPNDLLLLTQKPKPPISLEYQPMRPPHHPKPGSTLGQIIPPSNPEFNQTSNTVNLVDRIKDSVPSTTETNANQGQTPISLEYKPNRPFYHPNPGDTLSQIVPPGKPWPDRSNGTQSGNVNLEDRIKETSNNIAPTRKPISLEYQPYPPFHSQGGNTLKPMIPPGQPWPASQEEYQNFSQIAPPIPDLTDRIKDTIPSTTEIPKRQTPISLEYQPMRPPFHPNPGNNISPIVPPGEPWPASPEGYQNFSQILSPRPNFDNQIQETASSTEAAKKQTPISLEYQPSRPSFHPNPGDYVAPIVPPGDAWPSSGQGYQNFSQIPSSRPIEDRIKEDSKPGSSGSGRPNDVQAGSTPSAFDLLADFVAKQKEKTSAKPPQSGFIWETETSSGPKTLQSERPAETSSPETPTTTETPTKTGSAETSTLGAAPTSETLSVDGLFTSPPVKTSIEEDKIAQPAVPLTGIVKRNMPMNNMPDYVYYHYYYLPSHYIYYV